MEIQKIKISEEERKTFSVFMGEEYPLEIDFNWLMPCCKKSLNMIISEEIELDEKGNELWNLVETSASMFNLIATFNNFVAFIQWYNNTQKPTP